MAKKLGIYLPVKDKAKSRGYIENPGILSENIKNKILERIKKKFPQYEIIDNLDFKDFSIVNNDIIYQNEVLKLDVYFWYSHIMLSNNSPHLHTLKHLSRKCRVIKNTFAEQIGIDKFLAHELLHFKGLNVADYCFLSSRNLDFAKKILEKWGKLLVKPRFGSYGVGILLVEDFSTLRDLFGMIRETKDKREINLLVERFYPHDLKNWTSVTVFKHKAIYGYRKKVKNFAEKWKVLDEGKEQGNPETVDYVKPSKELKDAAEKASRVLNADIIGFDFIKTKEGYKIVDENTKPGLYNHCFKKANISVEDAFVSLLKK